MTVKNIARQEFQTEIEEKGRQSQRDAMWPPKETDTVEP